MAAATRPIWTPAKTQPEQAAYGCLSATALVRLQEWEVLLLQLKTAGYKGVLLSAGNSFYADILPAAKALQLDVLASRWVMSRSAFMRTKPELYAVNRKGESAAARPYREVLHEGYNRWLCPSHPAVKEHLLADFTELCAVPGLKGLHLDFIRYAFHRQPVGMSATPGQRTDTHDYCYCPRCRERFKTEQGTDPLHLRSKTQWAAWDAFRENLLVSLVNDIAALAHARGLRVFGSVLPTPATGALHALQPWERFHLDACLPQADAALWGGNAHWFRNCLQQNRKLLPEKELYYQAGRQLIDNNREALRQYGNGFIRNGAAIADFDV